MNFITNKFLSITLFSCLIFQSVLSQAIETIDSSESSSAAIVHNENASGNYGINIAPAENLTLIPATADAELEITCKRPKKISSCSKTTAIYLPGFEISGLSASYPESSSAVELFCSRGIETVELTEYLSEAAFARTILSKLGPEKLLTARYAFAHILHNLSGANKRIVSEDNQADFSKNSSHYNSKLSEHILQMISSILELIKKDLTTAEFLSFQKLLEEINSPVTFLNSVQADLGGYENFRLKTSEINDQIIESGNAITADNIIAFLESEPQINYLFIHFSLFQKSIGNYLRNASVDDISKPNLATLNLNGRTIKLDFIQRNTGNPFSSFDLIVQKINKDLNCK